MSSLLSERGIRTVLKGGRIRWQGKLREHPFLKSRVGEKVMIVDNIGDAHNDITVFRAGKQATRRYPQGQWIALGFICYIGGPDKVVQQ